VAALDELPFAEFELFVEELLLELDGELLVVACAKRIIGDKNDVFFELSVLLVSVDPDPVLIVGCSKVMESNTCSTKLAALTLVGRTFEIQIVYGWPLSGIV
jgi:hypothetical protein